MTHLLDLHLPSKGQLRFRQLQASSSSVSSGFRILLLWFCMISPMLAVQLYPIFTVFLLKIFERGFLLLKCFLISWRNLAPRLVLGLRSRAGYTR